MTFVAYKVCCLHVFCLRRLLLPTFDVMMFFVLMFVILKFFGVSAGPVIRWFLLIGLMVLAGQVIQFDGSCWSSNSV